MKTSILFFAFLLIGFNTFADESSTILVQSEDENITFAAKNGDGVAGILYICRGNPDEEAPPKICLIKGDPSVTLCRNIPGTKVLDVIFDHSYYFWDRDRKIGILSDSAFYIYTQHQSNPTIQIRDSIKMDQLEMAAGNSLMEDYILVQKIDDQNQRQLHHFKYDNSDHIQTINTDIVPEVHGIQNTQYFMAGINDEEEYYLTGYNLKNGSENFRIALGPLSYNLQEMLIRENNIYLLSTPGDSIITFTNVNKDDQSLQTEILYEHSGSRYTSSFPKHTGLYRQSITNFHFLPDSTPDTNDLIMSYNLPSGETDTFSFNKPINSYAPVPFAGGYYNFPFFHVGGEWVENEQDSLHLSEWESEIVSIPVCARPDFAFPDYRHDFSSIDEEAEKAFLKVFPNPVTNDELNIEIHGLDKTKNYQLQIFNNDGGKIFQQDVRVNDNIELPFADMKTGIYHLVFQFQDGSSLTRKVIKQ